MHCGFRCAIICTMVYSQVCLKQNLTLQGDEALTPGQLKEGFLPLFPHSIPIFISTVGAPGGTKPG